MERVVKQEKAESRIDLAKWSQKQETKDALNRVAQKEVLETF